MTFLSILVGKKLQEGTLCRGDHQGLSKSITIDWKNLGRQLGILEEDLDSIDKERDNLYEKAYQMLRLWKENNASDATYRVLCQALCHEYLKRRDLAERFCFR